MMMECGIWHRMNEIKTVTYAKNNKNKEEKMNLFSERFTCQRLNPREVSPDAELLPSPN